jgi:hypothetical protein
MTVPVYGLNKGQIQILYLRAQSSGLWFGGRRRCKELVTVNPSKRLLGKRMEVLSMIGQVHALLDTTFSAITQSREARLRGCNGILERCNKGRKFPANVF